MKHSLVALLALVALAGQAHAAEIRVSIGVRETSAAGPIGSNGGGSGGTGIEWVGRPNDGIEQDVNLVPADNAWHQVTFDLNNGPFRAFTGNDALTSTTGFSALEHLRFANTTDGVTHYKVYVDDIISTVNGTPTTLTGFEGFANGTEVLFQDPAFSGSTSGLLKPTPSPNINAVTDEVAFSGTKSYKLEWDFINDNPAGAGGSGTWVRVTTSGATNLPNAAIGVPNTSLANPGTATLSMQLRIVAIPEPTSLSLLAITALGGLVGNRRKLS